ncbi:MAG: FAD/NAD(P)-binding protein [Mucilaginibacter sp.]|uniref:FAD/NAD(P)-binding protein n=1 Tax=Mucilaginibacter sp. TaxID=1882438 RepID=UPI0032667BC9
MEIADVLVIGSGAAATITLIELFTKLVNEPSSHPKLNITIVEKHHEFWKGIPYGSRSSVNSLTITAISDFISSGKEKDLFFTWLTENFDSWSAYYRSVGGLAAETWLEENRPLIEKSDWAAIYLPRFVFGIYMQSKMLGLLKQVQESGLANITQIQAEAIGVKYTGGEYYAVELEYPDRSTTTANTKKMVVAIGSAPVKKNAGQHNNDNYVYINDLYQPALDDNLQTLKQAFATTPDPQNRNLLIIGSNASCIELMYLLDHRPDLLELTNQIVTISQTGIMPYHISDTRYDVYPCQNLDHVKATGGYDIHTLIEATKKDLAPAVQQGVIVPYVDRVIGYTLELMQPLDEDSKKLFFGVYGPHLTRLIRRSGPAYKAAANSLIAKQKLHLLKGSFLNLEPGENGALLNYLDQDGHQKTDERPFKVIINCSGANELHDSSSRLIRSLVEQNLCHVNLSGKGFLVNESFEAAPNLYIMGPLLGGNMNKRIHFWHLENVARLLYLAPYLAEHLLS